MITEQQLIALAIANGLGVDNGEFGVLWFDTNPLPFAHDIIVAIVAAAAESCEPVYQVRGAYGDPWREVDLLTYSFAKWASNRRILYTTPQPQQPDNRDALIADLERMLADARNAAKDFNEEAHKLAGKVEELERVQGVLVGAAEQIVKHKRDGGGYIVLTVDVANLEAVLAEVQNGEQQ